MAWCRIEKVGSLFPTYPFKGIIHSVFPQTINLEIPDSPLLYSLLTQPMFLHPLAVLVSKEWRGTFETMGLQKKSAYSFNGKTLQIGSSLTLDFSTAQKIQSREEELPELTLSAPELSERLDAAGKGLETVQRQKNTKLRWDTNTREGLYLISGSGKEWPVFRVSAHQLIQGLCENNPTEAVSASLKLVGLGEGLTPSGDDFLCGLTLALCMGSKSPLGVHRIDHGALDAWLKGLETVLGLGTQRSPEQDRKAFTGRVSKTFLYLATQRKFSTLLLQLGRAFTSDLPWWGTLLNALSLYGHSSGLDCATGFLYGISAVDPRRN